MKFLILVAFSIYLFTINTSHYRYTSKKYLPFNIAKSDFSESSHKLYKALITGNKSRLPKKLKESFKSYGLMHLLTPSGLHLSSIYILNYLPRLFSIFIFLILLQVLSTYGSYFSLERVLLFKIIHKSTQLIPLKLNSLTIFSIVIVISILSGNYLGSPLSFTCSLLFWGTVLIFYKKKLNLILFLNISLHISSSYFGTPVHISSILINPILSSLMVFIFPFLFFNYSIGGLFLLNYVINFILEVFSQSVIWLHHIDIFPIINFQITELLIFTIFLLMKKSKLGLTLILCLPLNLNSINPKIYNDKIIYNLESINDYQYSKKNLMYFNKVKCDVNGLVLRCKKRPFRKGP